MESASKASRILPTLSLILAFIPAVLCLILVAFSLNGNWGFLILGGITYFVSEILCGITSLTLSILCIRQTWGRKRAITALILSSLGLVLVLELTVSFWLKGLLI